MEKTLTDKISPAPELFRDRQLGQCRCHRGKVDPRRPGKAHRGQLWERTEEKNFEFTDFCYKTITHSWEIIIKLSYDAFGGEQQCSSDQKFNNEFLFLLLWFNFAFLLRQLFLRSITAT